MRSVPHRVVCLLGLDDGVFPRKAPRDGDDLMLDDPHVGERDARTEDRQLLLDALMAATDRLIVTYTGNDERTNSPRPPAVPVGELLDVVDRTVRATRERVRRRATRCSRSTRATSRSASSSRPRLELRPRHARGRAGAGRGAPRAGAVPRRPAAAAATRRVVELDDLVRFVEHPVRAFLRQRLGISVGDYSDEVEDALPVELDGLESGASASGCSRRGSPAPTAAGGRARRDRARDAPARRARPAGDRARAARRRGDRRARPPRATPGSVDVEVALPDGRVAHAAPCPASAAT